MRILHDNGQGGVAVIVPSPQYLEALKEANPSANETQVMEFIAQKDVPSGTAFEIVEDADIPTDRTFRDAWEHDTSAAPEKIKTNMAKAKAIAHDMRRAARAEKFAPLDIQATIPAQATEAEAKRQVIRDEDAARQIAIDAATTEAELKAALA